MGYIQYRISRSRKPWTHRKKQQWDWFMDPKHFKQMLKSIKKFPVNKGNRDRDYMLFMLMGNLGLRIGEVALLQKEHFTRLNKNPIIAYVPALKQRKKKKGEDIRKIVYVHPKVKEKIQWYMKKVMYKNDKYFFIGTTGDGHLSPRHIRRIFYTYCIRVGFEENYSPHSLRHMYGTIAMEKTHDEAFIRDQLGHATISKDRSSTNRYIHLSPERATKLVNLTGYIL